MADQIKFEVPGHKLTYVKFNASEVDKFEFKNSLVQFKNCVASVNSEKAKLSHLKDFLEGYASQLISHFSLEDDNYSVAVYKSSKKKILDIHFIIDEIFK